MANEPDKDPSQSHQAEEKRADLERGLDLAVETFRDGFKQLRDDFRSIQNRAGVGLTLSVAALSGSAIRIRDRLPTLVGQEKIYVTISVGIGGLLLVVAIWLFIEALRARNLPYGYNYDIILAGQWQEGGVAFQRQMLSDLGDYIKQVKTIIDARGFQLNLGVLFSILGVLIMSVLEIILGPMPKV